MKVSPAQLAARCPCMDALWPVDCSAATRIRVVVRVCVCVCFNQDPVLGAIRSRLPTGVPAR